MLIKHAYSCNSYKLSQAQNKKSFIDTISTLDEPISNYIIQKKLSITKDLRINYVGNQCILAFWRHIAENQISTASKFDSHIDHFSIPFSIYKHALGLSEIFDAPIGGIDFAWETDQNVHTHTPYLLEISPLFDVNPIPFLPVKNWGKFKKSWNWKKHYMQSIIHAAQLQISYMIDSYFAYSKR